MTPEAPAASSREPLLPLLHLDEELAVVHKPSGIHTHPSALSPGEDSAARWLAQQLGRRVWPVHRLDRGASGLLAFALSAETASWLIDAFRARRVAKRYLALARGWLEGEGEVERPLRDGDPASRQPALQEALTRWRVLARAEAPFPSGRGAHAFPATRVTLLECRPETGRMHQIRRHLAGIGHPLLGDGPHGDRHLNRVLQERTGLERMALVCVELTLPRPDGGSLALATALDPDLRRVLARLELPDPTAGRETPPLFDGALARPGRAWRARAARSRVLAARPPRWQGEGELRPFAPPAGSPPACPLCAAPTEPLHEEQGRRYHACGVCGLVHRDRAQWPDAASERARLERHRNRGGDAGYRDWLRPLARALAARLPAGARGQDLGCGPQAVLAELLEEAGLRAASWDPIFHPQPPPAGPLAWVSLCEVLEHASAPDALLEQVDRLLEPGGWLALSTGVLESAAALPGWWYARDPGHRVFATAVTLEWIARRHGWRLEREHGLVLYHKTATTREG
jgi:tRNA pseudouridine65 synthase